ncbi:hypothetical protein BGX38DRAFT_1157536, partial [Terfezia claveryi]
RGGPQNWTLCHYKEVASKIRACGSGYVMYLLRALQAVVFPRNSYYGAPYLQLHVIRPD